MMPRATQSITVPRPAPLAPLWLPPWQPPQAGNTPCSAVSKANGMCVASTVFAHVRCLATASVQRQHPRLCRVRVCPYLVHNHCHCLSIATRADTSHGTRWPVRTRATCVCIVITLLGIVGPGTAQASRRTWSRRSLQCGLVEHQSTHTANHPPRPNGGPWAHWHARLQRAPAPRAPGHAGITTDPTAQGLVDVAPCTTSTPTH